jgi:hypothetical protein
LKRSVLTIVSLLAAAFIAVLIVVRSRDASSVAPSAKSAPVSETSPVALEPVDSASPTASDAPAAKRDELQPATASAVDTPERENRAPTARFRGRIVYESTREPVPWCVVAVRGPGQSGETHKELRMADEQGRFATAFEYPAAALDVLAWDEPKLPEWWEGAQSVEHTPTNPTEVEIAVRAWPTIIVDGGMPEGRDPRRWKFSLGPCMEFDDARATRSGVLLWRNHPPPGSVNLGLDELARNGPPWLLVIDDEQRSLCCTLALEHIDGVIHVSPLWQKPGALDVTVKTNLSKSPGWQMYLKLRPALTCRDEEPRFKTLGNRVVHLDDLRPGNFVVDVTCQFCQPVRVPVTIHAGETAAVEVSIACEQPAGSIRGVVTTESGALPEEVGNVLIQVQVGSNGELIDVREIQWSKENGVAVGRFELRNLPSRAYELSLTPNAQYATRPETPLSVRPGDEVQFTLLDVASKIDIGFDVVDQATGTALDGFLASAVSGSRNWTAFPAHSHNVLIDDVRENSSGSWCISQRGYAFVTGTFASAARVWTVDAKRRWVRVELQRGTRVNVVVLADNGGFRDGPPLAGAAVLIDGHEVGRTDDRGRFESLVTSPIQSLDVSYLDWRHSTRQHSQPIVGSGRFTMVIGEFRFTLEPR